MRGEEEYYEEEQGTLEPMPEMDTEENIGEEKGEEDDDPLPPPPPEQEKELLFLIEFMVDTMTIMKENLDLKNVDPCALEGPVRLALTFLHFPPMLVGETDTDPDKKTGGDIVQFNSGKSLVFALTESQFEDPPPVYLLVEASKLMPHAFRFPYLALGKAKIDLSELFKQVFDKYDEQPGKTVSKSIKDNYRVVGAGGKPGAEISIYIRLTCLGENIITEFSKPEDVNDALFFKNKDSIKAYECKEIEVSDDEKALVIPGWGGDKKEECEDETSPPSPPPPPPDPQDENFEQIFAEINGSAILVSVEKCERKPKPKQFHVDEFCDCNIPLPRELVAGMSDESLIPGSEASTNFPSGAPVQIDKRVGLDYKSNRLQFNVPPAELLSRQGADAKIQYNVKTCGAEDEHGHKGQGMYRVVTDDNGEGPPPTMPNDPEKDVFVLRIIKRGKKEKTKDVLELEFKTPKEKILPPKMPPYMIERGSGPEKQKKKKKK